MQQPDAQGRVFPIGERPSGTNNVKKMIDISPKLLATIMMKRLWEEKPMRLIASELGISEGKARRYFHRGMFRIQKAAGKHQTSGRLIKF